MGPDGHQGTPSQRDRVLTPRTHSNMTPTHSTPAHKPYYTRNMHCGGRQHRACTRVASRAGRQTVRPPRDATRTARLGRRRLVWPNASIRSKPTWAEPERITVSRHAHAVQDEARVSDWHGGGGLGLGGTTATCVSLALTSSLVTAAALPPPEGSPPLQGVPAPRWALQGP